MVILVMVAFARIVQSEMTLPQIALAKAKKYQQTPNSDQFYLIGDTPHDVRCGQAIGALTITIASKRYSVAELIECGSWLVWESFPNPTQFIEKIGLKE